MLPVSTPPNAIVFATGRISISEMIKYGFLMDAIGVCIVPLIVVAIVGPDTPFDDQGSGV